MYLFLRNSRSQHVLTVLTMFVIRRTLKQSSHLKLCSHTHEGGSWKFCKNPPNCTHTHTKDCLLEEFLKRKTMKNYSLDTFPKGSQSSFCRIQNEPIDFLFILYNVNTNFPAAGSYANPLGIKYRRREKHLPLSTRNTIWLTTRVLDWRFEAEDASATWIMRTEWLLKNQSYHRFK